MGVPVVTGWISIMSGRGDAAHTGESFTLEFGYGFGHAEGRGALNGHGTGCGYDDVNDRGSGCGVGSACHKEIQL